MQNEYPKGVEVVASTLIINKKGEILLIKSHKWGDYYLIPGGHIEPNETIIEAAKREGEEETGLKLKPLYCVNIGELINDPTFNRRAHFIYFHFVCKSLNQKPKLDEKELKEFIWIEPKKALKLSLTGGVKETIENYINGVKINITSHHTDFNRE